MDSHELRSVAELIRRNSGKVVAFTGAGISAEAGIPTFRGKGGLWERYNPEELATPQAFFRDPKLVWDWYLWRMSIIARARPTPAHEILALWEDKGILRGVVTQNVDGLHQRAGSKNLVELHGSIWRIRCTSCSNKVYLGFGNLPGRVPPECDRCGSIMRPDVVWFYEPLPRDEWMRAEDMIRSASLLLIIGTSGLVMPAATLPIIALQNRATLVEINPEETNLSSLAKFRMREGASRVLIALNEILEGIS
jgi:NAD-dependent deacetylase